MERVANDNALAASGPQTPDPVLRAALKHFAQHGLGAARLARAQAQAAFTAKDRQSYEWWLDITRTLDRRLAGELERFTPDFA